MRLTKRFLFAILFLLISLKGLELLYGFFLLENRNIKSAYVSKEKINAEVLILGPCVPVWMISPTILDKHTGLKSFNLAQSHSDLADNFLHLHLYLKNNLPPKYLLLYISPESFDIRYNEFNTYRFASFLGDTVVNDIIKKQDPEYYKWSGFPFMAYAYYSNKINFNVLQGVKHFASGKNKAYFEDGFEPPFEIWKSDSQAFTESYPKNQNFIWSSNREGYLNKIIQICKAFNIKLILFESPIYSQSAKFQPNRSVFINRIKEISNYNKIEYLNFDTMLISNDKDNFKTTINLNKKASEEFTETFGKYLKKHAF